MDEREQHLRDAQHYAKKAERWSTVAMWGSGCALALYGLAALLILGVVGIVVWIVIAD